MRVEVSYWCFTLHAENRGVDVEELKQVLSFARKRQLSFGSVGIVPYPGQDEEEKFLRSIQERTSTSGSVAVMPYTGQHDLKGRGSPLVRVLKFHPLPYITFLH